MEISVYDSNNLNFVELNITGDNNNYVRCDKESKFVDSEVFNLFTKCFESANKLYDYFFPTKYNSRKIIPLRNELIKNLENLNSIKTQAEFSSFVSSQFLGNEFLGELSSKDKNWEQSWKNYHTLLINVNIDLISLTEKCADQERILWVIGY
ncbi:MAG: hypothetical protein JXJ22_03015 [Bacteroidales bacterium]|nr:hypothetical protein [Bacteroidales bacterium]